MPIECPKCGKHMLREYYWKGEWIYICYHCGNTEVRGD